MKNIFKNYTRYLKDNPKEYWFKRKIYGWGWTPAKWQGWLVIGIFIIFILWNGFSLESETQPSESELVWFFVRLIIAVAILILICYKKGEKPRWQWGLPKQEE